MTTNPASASAAAALPADWRPPADDGVFRRALIIAGVLHALLFVGLWHAKPRVIGDPDGIDGPITVEIVTPDQATSPGANGQPSPPPAEPVPDLKPSEPVEPEPAPPQPQKQADAKPEPKPEPKPADTPAPEKPAAAPLPLQSLSDTPDLFTLPDPSHAKTDAPAQPQKDAAHKSATEPHKDQAKKPSVKTSKLDLSLPDKMATEPGAGGGFSAASIRPPDITKSPQNDEFGRGVIRALRATMPPHPGPSNRVTIRIILNDQGNVKDVSVIRHSDDATLDQQVAFSAMQASYPIPPAGSTQSDRTFLVTYIYR